MASATHTLLTVRCACERSGIHTLEIEEDALEVAGTAVAESGASTLATAGTYAGGALLAGGAAGAAILAKKTFDSKDNATPKKGYVLPGSDYIGPGSDIHIAPARSEADQIAKDHNISYDAILKEAREKEYTQQEFFPKIQKIDQEAIDRFNYDISRTGSWHAYAGYSYYGLKIKHAVEGAVKQNIYPTLDNVNSNTTEQSIESGYDAYTTPQPNTTPSSKVPEGSSAASKRPATSNIEEQAETQIKKPALRPSTRIQATKQAAATSTPGPTSNPQQETLVGNAPNSKGSVSGEAGTRKSQKPQGLIFGSIQNCFSQFIATCNHENNIHNILMKVIDDPTRYRCFCPLLEWLELQNIGVNEFGQAYMIDFTDSPVDEATRSEGTVLGKRKRQTSNHEETCNGHHKLTNKDFGINPHESEHLIIGSTLNTTIGPEDIQKEINQPLKLRELKEIYVPECLQDIISWGKYR
nr:unnamed protein product [Callosobruchus analis]